MVFLDKEKMKELVIEPLVGVTKDILLSAKYSRNDEKIKHREGDSILLSPMYGLRIRYPFSEHYSIASIRQC